MRRVSRILITVVGVGIAWLAFHAGGLSGAGRGHAQPPREPHAIVRASAPTTVRANVDPARKLRSSLDSAERGQIADRLGTAAVGFVANVGQTDPTVRFHGAAPHAGFYASDRGMTVALGTEAATKVLTL